LALCDLPFAVNLPLPTLLRHAAALQRQGRSVYACLVVHARGSTPQSAGALMLVDDAGASLGTIGGGCVEAEVRRRAFEMLLAGASGVAKFTLNHDYGWDDGLICGGTLEMSVGPAPSPDEIDATLGALSRREPSTLTFVTATNDGPAAYALRVAPPERLYIAGAGHVGQSLARLAMGLEFEVTVFDDRADLMDAYLPSEVRKVGGDIARSLASAPIDAETFCVVVTRGHKHDEQALEAVVGRGARYVGMIGSRRKVKLIFDDLAVRGVSRDELARVHAPIGLPIDAVSVEEIGVSIAAQLVEKRRERRVPLVVRMGGGVAGLRVDA
jgi:xanthine dehydrogenase accessory factor